MNANNLRRKPKRTVTLIAGFVCKDCIVVASDSRTTYISSFGHTSRDDSFKIEEIQLANGSALVAEAGHANMSRRAIEMLNDAAKGQPMSDYRTVADMAQIVMRRLKNELRIQQCDCTVEQLQAFISDYAWDFELMIAHYYQGKPYVFTIDFLPGIACSHPQPFTAIGSGAALANYILSWFKLSEMQPSEALLAGLYLVQEVQKTDPFCGGLPKIGAVGPDKAKQKESVAILKQWDFSKHLSRLQMMTAEARAEFQKKLLETIQNEK